jgi:pimeloyl-ACP methyl ester carboxylesterase
MSTPTATASAYAATPATAAFLIFLRLALTRVVLPVTGLGHANHRPSAAVLPDRAGFGLGVGLRAIPVAVHYVERGDGTLVLLLHGAGVDHREPLGTIEPAFAQTSGYRRVYPDLPGHGRTPAPVSIASADDVLGALLGLIDDLAGEEPLLVAGHSAGGYYARAIARHRPHQVIGLALICPLLEDVRDMPAHTPIVQEHLDGEHDAFRSYFVVQTPEMLRSYREHVRPGVEAADLEALERIGGRWRLTAAEADRPYGGPVLVVAGRQDSAVGYAAQWDLTEAYPRGTFALLDRAGHALPHEQPELLGALLREWLGRVERP